VNPMLDRFSDPGRQVMARALSEAQALGHPQLGPEHMLLALFDGGDDPAAALRKVRLSAKRVRESIVAIVGREEPLPAGETLPLSDRARKVVGWAVRLADAADSPVVTPAHLLLALSLDNDGTAIRILHQRSVDPFDLGWAILDRLAPDRQSDLSTGYHQAVNKIRMDVEARSRRVGDSPQELCDISDGLGDTERRLLARLTDKFRVSRATADGDRASYSRLVRMVQPFATRYPVVEGRGNFGSIDADPPADMQYTEVRVAQLAADISSFPYLLANGGPGIPPHNLDEVIAATLAYLDDPTLDTTGLLEHLRGPDFPTAGTVVNGHDLHEIYDTGSGSIQIQGQIAVEPAARSTDLVIKQLPFGAHKGGTDLVITQLPFGAHKGGDGGLITQIVDLVHDRTLAGISDITDQSNDLGMRLIVTIRSEVDPDAVVRTLHERTMLQLAVPVDMIALVDGTPQRLSLHGLISQWVTARRRDHSDDDIGTQLQAVADRHSSTRLTAIT
jgi:hypothetical protein